MKNAKVSSNLSERKPTVEMYVLQSLQKQFSGFPFFNPVFKNAKIRYVFVTISKNVLDNWTKIGYSFGPLKYRPNTSSGKLRIKSQLVRVKTFCVKILLTARGDSQLLTLYILVADIEYFYREWGQN